MKSDWILSVNDPRLGELCSFLSDRAEETDQVENWPEDQLDRFARLGVHRWFIPTEFGGLDWPDAHLLTAYLQLAEACVTTAFVLTQRVGACRRLAASTNRGLAERLLPGLLEGHIFATIGLSQLTTSHQHLRTPTLMAEPTFIGYRLEGFIPWVTGAAQAETILVGAACPGGEQVLLAVPTDAVGLTIDRPMSLLALSGSQTSRVRFEQVKVSTDRVVAGPAPNLMSSPIGGRTGGLETSTLALGLCRAALRFLREEASQRPELEQPTLSLEKDFSELFALLYSLAEGTSDKSAVELRSRANSLVLRATQTALSAAKGAGFVDDHPVARWCRQALFFLVWSCPAPVQAANLCELAGLA